MKVIVTSPTFRLYVYFYNYISLNIVICENLQLSIFSQKHLYSFFSLTVY